MKTVALAMQKDGVDLKDQEGREGLGRGAPKGHHGGKLGGGAPAADAPKPHTVVNTGPGGRNDPCPCKSGQEVQESAAKVAAWRFAVSRTAAKAR